MMQAADVLIDEAMMEPCATRIAQMLERDDAASQVCSSSRDKQLLRAFFHCTVHTM